MNDLKVRNMGKLAEDVYDNAFFSDSNSKPPSVPGYQVLAASPPSSNGFQALLLEMTDSNVDGSQYVFAFRGTDTDNGLSELLMDGLFTDLAQIATGDMASQFIEAIMKEEGT